MRTVKQIKRGLCAVVTGIAIGVLPLSAIGARPLLVGMGDSIGEGVQGADAAWQTQAYSYISLVNWQMGGDLTQPYIVSNPLGIIGNTDGRSRLYPNDINTNVAVSGATTNSLLYDRAQAASPGQISSETDLVMYPRQQTQIEYVESVQPHIILCWIGNNDVLSTALSFGNMNASQLTPLADFERDYIALADRLGALSTNHDSKVVFANIPDVTSIGFLVDRNTAESITGFAVPLPDGHYTSIVGAFLMQLTGNSNLINDPNFVLDDAEVALIRARTQEFNTIIQREADRIGMPVVDANSKFNEFVANPPVITGIPLRTTLLGGLFSLDGVHPSNIGHAFIANEFIKTMNQSFAMSIPEISSDWLTWFTWFDPSIDKDGDGKATGRFGVGLLETLAFMIGATGDANDFQPD